MTASTEYNGHPSHAHWNVSLWLFNDEPMYRLMQDVLRSSTSHKDAARELLAQLPKRTPDGVAFTFATVLAAIEEEQLGR